MKYPQAFKEDIRTTYSIGHSITTGWSMNRYHFHDVFEIYFTATSGVRYFINDKVYTTQGRDLFLFTSRDIHKSLVPADLPYDRYVLTFKPEYVQRLFPGGTDLLACFLGRSGHDNCHLVLSDRQVEKLVALFDKAEYYFMNNPYGADIYRQLYLTEILLLVNEYFLNAGSVIPPDIQSLYGRIKPVIRHIQEHLNEDLTLDRLAGEFFLNKHYLGRVFKKATGFTLNEYIIKCRIMKACELLKAQMPVSLAGEMVGYGNCSHFIRTFKKLTGLSPKQYVKQAGREREVKVHQYPLMP